MDELKSSGPSNQLELRANVTHNTSDEKFVKGTMKRDTQILDAIFATHLSLSVSLPPNYTYTSKSNRKPQNFNPYNK